jgi:hypothetical protein
MVEVYANISTNWIFEQIEIVIAQFVAEASALNFI